MSGYDKNDLNMNMFYDSSKAKKFENIANAHKPAVIMSSMLGDSILSGIAQTTALNALLNEYSSTSIWSSSETAATNNNTNNTTDTNNNTNTNNNDVNKDNNKKDVPETPKTLEKKTNTPAAPAADTKVEKPEETEEKPPVSSKVDPSKAFAKRHDTDKLDTEISKLSKLQKELKDLESELRMATKDWAKNVREQIAKKKEEITAQEAKIARMQEEFKNKWGAKYGEENSVQSDNTESTESQKKAQYAELDRLYKLLFENTDKKNKEYEGYIQKQIGRIMSSLPSEEQENFKETSKTYKIYNDYMSGKKVYDFKSAYAPKKESEIKEPARTKMMNAKAEQIREDKIANPKQGSELFILKAKLATAQRAAEQGYQNVQGVGSVSDLEAKIRQITSGKREAEIKTKMEELEQYINTHDDRKAKSKKKEYEKLYKELENLY